MFEYLKKGDRILANIITDGSGHGLNYHNATLQVLSDVAPSVKNVLCRHEETGKFHIIPFEDIRCLKPYESEKVENERKSCKSKIIVQYALNDIPCNVYNDMFSLIKYNLLHNKGIDYRSSLDRIRIVTTENGPSTMMLDGKPFCAWGNVRFNNDPYDHNLTRIKAEVTITFF